MSARIVLKLHRRERRKLEKRLKKTRDAAERTRLQIILLYAQGKGSNEIASVLGCNKSHATRVARNYRTHGDLAFEDGRKNNGRSIVDDDLRQALAELVAGSPQDYGWNRPTWTIELLKLALARETGVKVSTRTTGRMLDDLGARHGMPKPIVACPWPKARKTRRIRYIMDKVKKLPRDEVAYFEDEVDIHLNPKIGRDWMLKGHQKKVLTPGKNAKRYLAGALSIDGRHLIYAEWEHKNSDIFILLLKKLKDHHPEARKIHVVLDNCSIHSSKKVQIFLRYQKGLFVLHFLPPYSPDYNKIERFWRDLHANVTRNHRCNTINSLMKSVRRYMDREAQRRLRSRVVITVKRRNTKRRAA